MLIDICLPVHNDEIILEKNVLRLFTFFKKQNFSFDWKIIIIVNGSSDQSSTIAHQLTLGHKELTTYNITSAGKGNALYLAWEKSSADILVCMDSDLAADLNNIQSLLVPLIENGVDMTIGCRLHKNSSVKRSLSREVISRGYNFLARRFLHIPYHDLQCGFKAIKKDVFTKLSHYTTDKHWFFDTELITWAHYFDYKIEEIPISWEEERFKGRASSVKVFKDSLFFIKNLYKLRKKILNYKK